MNVEGDLTWSALLAQECPYLYKLISPDGKTIDEEKLRRVMNKLDLAPCKLCVQQSCANLWKYYIESKQGQKCGNAVVKPGALSEVQCREAAVISEHLFGDSLNLYEIQAFYKLEELEHENHWETGVNDNIYRVSKKRGDALLKMILDPTPQVVQGYETMRFCQTQDTDLQDYFVIIYELQTLTKDFQPSRKKSKLNELGVLTETMDGDLKEFKGMFVRSDTKFWTRFVRMCTHALYGLWKLNSAGFRHGKVNANHCLFRLSDTKQQLMSVKWNAFECVDFLDEKNPTAFFWSGFDPLTQTGSDKFAFGMMIYELLYGPLTDSPKKWNVNYMNNDKGRSIYQRILRLTTDVYMQPLSTIAYHFIVNEKLFPSEKRWTYEEAFEYLKEHPVNKADLPLLPHSPNW